ncbi:subclass B1 metallo-beta-lactamase [Prolixibacter denitrificans]|jgi:metallo-beta-lactamase class B|nr:subclass B1 metallo-beta-lactamase [Prolixibacter denitrificans]
MKKWLVISLMVFLQGQVWAQQIAQRLKVSDDIVLVKLSERAYVHISQAEIPPFGRVSSNGLIFVNGKEAFLFDTPVTEEETRTLVDWLKSSMEVEVVGFVPNHWHIDCMGGLAYLQQQHIPSWANQITVDSAKVKGLPVPDHRFTDSLQLKLGDKTIECYYLGPAHATDNIVVWIPSEKILFPGCLVKSMNSRTLGNTGDGDLKAYPATIIKVIDKFTDARIVIPGHGPFGGPELLRHTYRLAESNQ